MKRKWFVLLTAALALLSLAAAPKKALKKTQRPAWGCHVPPDAAGKFSLESLSKEACIVRAERTEEAAKKAYCEAITDVNREMWSHNKVVFSIRSINGKALTVSPRVSHPAKDGKKGSTLVRGPLLKISGNTWRDCVLGLDSDFKLGDASFQIRQLKFSVGIGDWKPGEKGGIELKNVRICQASEVTLSNAKSDDLIVVRARPVKKIIPAADALMIYFALDNEDHDIVINQRKPKIRDTPDFGGFREILLEEMNGLAVETEDLDKADLIVYAVCRPLGKESAEKIAAKVKAGTPLYVASEVADPGIGALLPCKVVTPGSKALPVRASLKVSDPAHPVVKKGGFNDAPFGKYHTITLRKNAKTILSFADGTPAVVEGTAGKGKVIYNSLSLGAGVVPGRKAFDAFFIRIASYLGKRELPEERRSAVLPDKDGWYEGASKNNFGRFGFEVGDGLPVGSIGTKLAVTNGSSEYEFSTEAREKIRLPEWIFTSPGKVVKKVSFSYNWPDLGVSTMETKVTIPAAWKGRKLFFHVARGIDDTADVYFNGKMIGSVTRETPHYWEIPHRHAIPENLIRFNAPNDVKVIINNIKWNGKFNSCPEIIFDTPPKTYRLAIDRINYIGKGGYLLDKGRRLYRYDTSLAFPGTRWEFYTKSCVMSLYNIASFAAYQTKSGVKILDLAKLDSIPTDASAPWMLFFNGSANDNPLLLVFQHRMKKIKINRSGASVSGLEFEAKENSVGALIPVWIGGSAPVNASAWSKGLPQDLQKRIAFWYKRALHIPGNVKEDFRLLEKQGRIEIRDTYSYLDTKDDWNTPVRDYAPVSPLAYYMKGRLFASSQAEKRDLPTAFGYFADRDGANSVLWSLPLPKADHSFLPHTKGFPAFEKAANDLFMKGFRFSAGGGVRYEARNLLYPLTKRNPDVKNCSMHSSLHGISQSTENPYIYDDASYAKLMERFAVRALEPLERAQYKMVNRWREEPFSGIRYANYFRSPRDIATKFEPGYGTTITYGDSNETVQMILTALQRAEDRFGQFGLARANWDAISRHIASYPLSEDDWLYMTSGCMDYGASATIDMLNCEYSSMMKLARLAEIAGDKAVHSQALYRAARRLVPTIARLTIRDYYKETGLLADADKIAVSTGFGEGGAGFIAKRSFVRELQLFDMSQGIPRDLLNAYRLYGLDAVRANYLGEIRAKKPGEINLKLIAILAEADNVVTNEQLLAYLEAWRTDPKVIKKQSSDWPGITCGGYLEYVLHRMKGEPVVATAKQLNVRKAVYDPETKTLFLRFEAGKNAELAVFSKQKLFSGGKQSADGLIRIDVSKPGKQEVVLKFK